MDNKKVTTNKGVADSQLSNLTRTKLIDELKRRGYSTKQLMNQDGLTGPEIEALATSGNGMNKGGSAMKKKGKQMGGIAIIIGMGKPDDKKTAKKNMGGMMLKKPEMMYGGMAGKKKHMYAGGGSVTDNAGLRALKKSSPMAYSKIKG
jgi:hypothetical protein